MRQRCITRRISCFFVSLPGREQKKQFAGSSSPSRHSISSHTGSRFSTPRASSYAGTTRRSAKRADRSCLVPGARCSVETTLRVDAEREVEDADDLFATPTEVVEDHDDGPV